MRIRRRQRRRDVVLEDRGESRINACGLAHSAYEVENVAETVREVLQAGGSLVGEVVRAAYSNRNAVFAYARDPEGNIIELRSRQKWTKSAE